MSRRRWRADPVVLLVAPLSGHHATLLRDTVRTMLGDHNVYITDWLDARLVPAAEGAFTLADYVGYLREFIRHIGAERLHIVSICQGAVPALAAVALHAAAGEPAAAQPGHDGRARSTRAATRRASTRSPPRKRLSWFEDHVIHDVPAQYPGHGRRVYPGFLQHAGFIAMNPARHMSSHWEFFEHLAAGDVTRADEHRDFYDEYNAVLDMPAEYYLDCIRIVFQEHLLPRGQWQVGGERVAPEAITRTALLTVEGEKDDISGTGQTEAALALCSGVPAERKRHLTVARAGHYGIFSGHRWRDIVYPQVRDLIAAAASASGSASD